MQHSYHQFKTTHSLPVEFDRGDVELVGKYIAYSEPVNSPTRQRLEDDGLIGAVGCCTS